MLYRRAGGAWIPSLLLTRTAGSYGPGPTLYRKVGGVWVTDAPLAASVSPLTLAKGDATAAKSTTAATVTPTGAGAPFTYSWTKVSGGNITAATPSAASTVFNASALADGEVRTAVFRCTVTDVLGNTANTENVTVTVERWSQPVVTLNPAGPIALAGAGTTLQTSPIAASVAGGTAPFTYAWTKVTGGDIVALTPSASSTVLKNGADLTVGTRSATFRCTVTDARGLTATKDVDVSMERWSQPSTSITPSALNTSGSTDALTTPAATANVTGGTAPFTYAWGKVSGGAITIDAPGAATTTFTASALVATGESRSATFRCTVTDANGLTATATVPVTIARVQPLSASASPSSLSKNLADTVDAGTTANTTANASGGTAPFTYSWAKVSGGAITIGTPGAQTTAFSASGMTQGESRTAVFRCTITDSNGGMAATGDVTVTITRANPPAPTATFFPPAGAYSDEATGSASVSLSCSEPAVWNYTKTGFGSADLPSGGSSTSITFTTVQSLQNGTRSGEFQVNAVSASGVVANYTLTLTALGTGGAPDYR